jgi:hypothetical protein
VTRYLSQLSCDRATWQPMAEMTKEAVTWDDGYAARHHFSAVRFDPPDLEWLPFRVCTTLLEASIGGPCFHEHAALSSASVCLFGLIADDMPELRYSLGEFETLPAQSRKLDPKPWTVASSTLIRRRTISMVILIEACSASVWEKRTRLPLAL